MYDAGKVNRISQNRKAQDASLDGEREAPFVTTSRRLSRRLYDPTDAAHLDYERDLGQPGEYPFTRGVHATGYRGKPWTMRMFAGFGRAQRPKRCFHAL